MWATHALGISYEIKKTQGIGSGQVLFFPFHDPFAMRSTISATLITICKANRPQTIRYIRLNRTKPTCGFLLFYFYLRAGKLWPCQRQESSQSSGTAIELGVRLKSNPRQKEVATKRDDKESPTNQCKRGPKWSTVTSHMENGNRGPVCKSAAFLQAFLLHFA